MLKRWISETVPDLGRIIEELGLLDQVRGDAAIDNAQPSIHHGRALRPQAVELYF